MHENTWEIVTFLIKLMFSRLDKFDRSLFEGVYIRAAYIWDVNLDTYLGGGGVYWEWGVAYIQIEAY